MRNLRPVEPMKPRLVTCEGCRLGSFTQMGKQRVSTGPLVNVEGKYWHERCRNKTKS